MKQTVLSFLMMLMPLMANAETVEIDGIWYNIITKANVAEVTRNPSLDSHIASYTGVVSIPAKITYNNVEYPVTKIGEKAFWYCRNVTSVTIPNSVITIGNSAFNNCTGLTSVNIPSSVTIIDNFAFDYCISLTSIDIPNSVTTIGQDAFNGCKGLKTVTIPTSVTSISSSAFGFCESLTSVTIPSNVTSIGTYAFMKCKGLTSLSIPNSVTSIGSFAFSDCSSLTSIDIPNSVTSIQQGAFQGCTGLTTIAIGNAVKEIGNNAFAQCSDIKNVYCMVGELSSSSYEGKGLYTYTNAFEGSYIEYATLHVPESAINAYNSTAPWSGFKEIVTVSGNQPLKCASPTITYNNGEITFSCDTEGVEFVSEVTAKDVNNHSESEISISNAYLIKVYAKKDGYLNSDIVTKEIVGTVGKHGDLTGDGEVNNDDHVKLTNIIMNQ